MSFLGSLAKAPLSLARGISRGAQGIGGGISDAYNAVTGDPGADDERKRKELLYQQAQRSGSFADRNERGFGALGARGAGALDDLQGIAQGRNSYSAEQLRQGLQQGLAAQQSMAAGASPRNAAGAARTAAIQMGRLGAGLAGQQSLAGIQERQQAQMAYANLLQGLRGQDLQGVLGARGTAMGGYGAQNAGAPEKSWLEKYGPAIQSGAAIAASDPKLKRDVRDGDKAARKATEAVGAYSFAYKDPMFGAGRQFGTMTSDLKRAGLGHAVIKTPAGEMVHGAKLATSTIGMVGALGRRLAKLEAKGSK